MYKKLIIAISFILFSQLCFAENCPSIQDIKNQTLAEGWKAYDSEEGTLLSKEVVAKLADHIDQFALAEWVNDGHSNGAVHCYYRDKHGSNLEAYLAKDNFKPDNQKNVWYQVSGFMHCAAGADQCVFGNNLPEQQQLAKK